MSAWPGADGALRLGWAQGLSASQIGHRIGVSKNAVIGRAHRLNLPPRPSPIVGASVPRVRPGRRLKMVPPILAFIEAQPVEPAPVVIQRKPAPGRTCDWPMWTDGPVPRPPVFCGEPVRWRETRNGWLPCSWCDAHYARVFQPERVRETA